MFFVLFVFVFYCNCLNPACVATVPNKRFDLMTVKSVDVYVGVFQYKTWSTSTSLIQYVATCQPPNDLGRRPDTRHFRSNSCSDITPIFIVIDIIIIIYQQNLMQTYRAYGGKNEHWILRFWHWIFISKVIIWMIIFISHRSYVVEMCVAINWMITVEKF